MHKTIAILGRQPALGIAELESLYEENHIQPFGKDSCFLDLDACNVDFDRLGGSVRVGTVLLELPSVKWSAIEKFLIEKSPEKASHVEGKLSFGLSVFGLNASRKDVARTALLMKKAIKSSGKSVRMVPHKDVALGSAVVLHNKLYKNNNWELLIVSDGKTAFLAQTNFIQDIDAYTARDQARPMRDAKVGMLPPKLAQILVNLSVANPKDENNKLTTILDPFCGTGVVLQEASLMGYEVYGTDIDPRMIEYSEANLKWLKTKYSKLRTHNFKLEIADATKHDWKLKTQNSKLQIACETFLGQPLSKLPPSEQLAKFMQQANEINHKFLQNISNQLEKGTRLCLAVPTWKGKREFLHLSALDYLEEMGYTRMKFKHVSNEDLIYHREGQIVGRELLVLIKN